MRGCKPLIEAEKNSLESNLHTARNKLLFLLGLSTGLRIQELLSIRVKDVLQHGKLVERIYIERKAMKARTGGRAVLLIPELHSLMWYVIAGLSQDDRLFPIERMQAWRIIKAAANAAKLQGKIATHSMRKTFADKVYAKSQKDLVLTQKALGHKDINNTVKYLSFVTKDLDNILKDI